MIPAATRPPIRALAGWLALLALWGCGAVPGDPAATVAEGSPGATMTGDAREEQAMSQAEHDRRIDYIEFTTTDMDRAKAFYSGVFGWKFTDYGPDYASFEDGRIGGGFVLAEKVSTGGPLVVLYAVDLEGIQAKIKEAGGTVVKETFEFPGGRRFHFTDSDGHQLAVWSDR